MKLKRTLVFLFIPLLVTLVAFFVLDGFLELPKAELLAKKYQSAYSQLDLLEKQLDSLDNVLAVAYKNDGSYRSILELDSVPMSIRQAGTGGSEVNLHLHRRDFNGQLTAIAQKIDRLERQLILQGKSYDYISENTRIWIEELKSIPSIMPVSPNDLTMISSVFGTRIDPFTHLLSEHHGYDYVAPFGTKVYATGNGIVTLSNYSRKGYGNEVIIDHNFGFSTRYAHLSEILTEQGDSVKRGQVIGLVGSTGRSTGPHLHYEVRYLNRPVNPYLYYADDLSGDEYEIMVGNLNSEK
ncbi:MAG: M23 family metallopeptidase [Bacteroidales bacterium]|nr:M23 family metallopeptidase [Bacteroidales bacterium]